MTNDCTVLSKHQSGFPRVQEVASGEVMPELDMEMFRLSDVCVRVDIWAHSMHRAPARTTRTPHPDVINVITPES